MPTIPDRIVSQGRQEVHVVVHIIPASGTAADPLQKHKQATSSTHHVRVDLGFPLGGCGCLVQPATCADGADSATCPYQQGDVAKLMSARANCTPNHGQPDCQWVQWD